MHEAGLMASVLDVVDKARRENRVEQVVDIALRVGRLNGALPTALGFAFDALRPAHDWLNPRATLSINLVEPALQCAECRYRGPTDDLWCPECGSGLTRLICGSEFELIGFEGVPAPASATPGCETKAGGSPCLWM